MCSSQDVVFARSVHSLCISVSHSKLSLSLKHPKSAIVGFVSLDYYFYSSAHPRLIPVSVSCLQHFLGPKHPKSPILCEFGIFYLVLC